MNEGQDNLEVEKVLTERAVDFLNTLHRKFNQTRLDLLEDREKKQKEIDEGQMPDFLASTQHIRSDSGWKVAAIPKDLEERKVEITGPCERKMMINALNSGANVFMADFEDSLSPTWKNIIEGQINLQDAVKETICYHNPDGKVYRLNKPHSTLIVRPRGWHLNEKHYSVNGKPISASLFDFGLYFFHNAHALIAKGTGPYFYLPKLEGHLEARLWNDVFCFAQDELKIPRGTIKATVLIETILAAFEMEEILYELRDHITGLNAGRWDYLFSIIKKFKKYPTFILPDRSKVTMAAPFMQAYARLLVETCHRRDAHAIGGMAAFIPSRKNQEINKIALRKVQEDKEREVSQGFDGTWVAHPDLVPIAREVFERTLQGKPHQKNHSFSKSSVNAAQLSDFHVPGASITEDGVRLNINVALQYLDSWLRGIGAAGIFNLMEDAATAEIARSQLWQWIHHHPVVLLSTGDSMTEKLYRDWSEEEYRKLKGSEKFSALDLAKRILDSLVLNENFQDFFTIKAYEYLK